MTDGLGGGIASIVDCRAQVVVLFGVRLSEFVPKQPPGVADEFEVACDSPRLAYETICKFEIVVYPPARCACHCAGEDIEASAQALIYGFRLSALHIGHKYFLLRRAHGDEYYIRFFFGYIVYESLSLGIVADVSVAVSYDAYVGIALAQAFYGLGVYFRGGSNDVECAVGVVSVDDAQPQLTPGYFDSVFGSFLSSGEYRSRAVAICDVVVDYRQGGGVGVQNLLGVDGHEYAGMCIGIIHKAFGRVEGVYFDSAQVHAVVGDFADGRACAVVALCLSHICYFLKMPQKSSITLFSRWGRPLKGVCAVRNTTISARS